MIKNIIFDLGNVIVQNPNLELAKQFFKDEKDAIVFSEFIFKSEFWKDMDLGKITNLEIANKIREQMIIHVSNYDEIENFMLNWFKKCKVNEKTIEIGKMLKQNGYKIYILSNMAKATFDFLKSNYDFFEIADGAVISAYEGIKKPDIRIFEILLNRYSLVAKECLLIDDDDTNRTIEVANSIGIKCRRVQPNSPEDIKFYLSENKISI